MRAPEFSAFVHPARLYPEIWRLLVGLLLICFVYLSTFALLIVVLYPITGPLEYFGWLSGLLSLDKAPQTLFTLLSFGGMLLGTVLATAAMHFRGAGTLFGPARDTIRHFGLTVMVLVPLYGGLLALSWMWSPGLPNLPFDQWLGLLPLAVPLIFLQITAEEVLFRGYLQQQLAARFTARWIWMGLPAVLFMLAHWNPEAGRNLWLILFAILCFALIAADLTEQAGNLGAAMGFHFVNNLFALLIISIDGTITGLALFVTPYQVDDASALPLGAALDLVLLFGVWRLLRAIILR